MVNPAGSIDPDESVFALTAHELCYLLALVSGDASETAIEVLGLPTPEEPGPMLVAGVATLLVRQLASIDVGDDGAVVVPGELAALVGENLTGESVWIELAFMSQSATEASYLSVGENSTIVLTPRLFGTFEVRFIRPEQSGGDGVAAMMLGFLSVHAPAVAYARVRIAHDDVALAVRLLDDGTMELSRNEGEETLSTSTATGTDGVARRVAEIIDEGVRRGSQK